MPANLGRPVKEVAIEAVDEVGNPTILATLTRDRRDPADGVSWAG